MKRIGRYTIAFEDEPSIIGYAAAAGKKEAEGPLAGRFDKVFYDAYLGQPTFEAAECVLQQEAVIRAVERADIKTEDVDFIFAGDLLNQCISSSFSSKEFNIPYLGQYGACSTFAQGIILAAIAVSGGAARTAACATSSHFCTAERQYRLPLEYGGQRTPTSQWTVTGAGCCVLSRGKSAPRVTRATVGRITDLDISDPNNMGAAMAPAAAGSIIDFFEDTGTRPRDYDLILTGDLGVVGSDCLYELLDAEGYDIRSRHNDCGLMIYDREAQDVHAGGSGAGCCAAVFCSAILPDMINGKYHNILFIPTGALMSPVSSAQGKSIPAVAHLVNITL